MREFKIVFNLIVLTIDKKVYEGDAATLSVPGSLGYFEVLKNHASIITALQPGRLTITNAQREEKIFAISGGIMEMSQNKAVVLGDAIEAKDEIDVTRARAAYQRAYQRLDFPTDTLDQHRALLAMYRAKNRIHVAGKDELLQFAMQR